ncbi:MAG: 3-demethylubiquinone-9 3-O-methyltransferase [Anaerolineales bacterium]|nr:3-demethylubiquinone-9 3-O-methyltransferase [Anaerolineales bacterium]
MKSKSEPKVDNRIYDNLAQSWWAGNGVLSLLRASVNPWRVPYFSQVIAAHSIKQLPGISLLDIGCGGGVLAEELSQIGCRVTGIDLSEKSLQIASQHTAETKTAIRYLAGSAFHLPFPDKSFEIAVCGDVLEHLPDWPVALGEVSRILKPGGIFLFDTINRTLASYLTLILGAQLIPFTRIFPPRTHNWRMFITPEEIKFELTANGLQPGGLAGSQQEGNLLMLLASIFLLKTGQISYQAFGERTRLQPGNDLRTNYLGFAIKE